MEKADYPLMLFKSQKEWDMWISKNHKTSGVWLKFAKKNSGKISVNYDQALDVALCFGWIDSQAKSFDESFYLQKFTPRGPKSIWSKINTEHVARLSKAGKMKPQGFLKVEEAKKDGRWKLAYHSPKDMVIPQDFLKLLSKNKKAEVFFKTLNRANTYAITWRLQTAKKEETRLRRMQVILEMLTKGEKFH